MKRFHPTALGLAFVVGLAGCSKQASQSPAADDHGSTVDAHDHHGAGPHGGTVTDWGGGVYHVEFTVDHDAKAASVYVLGSDGKTPSPIKADKLLLTITEPSFQVDLAAEPLDGEAAGISSRFVGEHANLGVVQEFAGTISGEVEGTPYAGDFK